MWKTLAHKSIYDHLTRIATVNEIVNVNVSKAPWKVKKKNTKKRRLALAAIAMQMQHKRIKGALA